MEIASLKLGPMRTNCYFVINNSQAIVIDPADEYMKILEYSTLKKLTISAILVTHGHFDHVGACLELQNLNIPIFMNEFDATVINETPGFYYLHKHKVFKPNFYVKNNQILNLIGLKIKVLDTPGHSHGSVSYKIQNNLFCGDLMFESGEFGRFDLYSGDIFELKNSIKKIGKLDDKIVVYPGHGQPTFIWKAKEILNDLYNLN